MILVIEDNNPGEYTISVTVNEDIIEYDEDMVPTGRFLEFIQDNITKNDPVLMIIKINKLKDKKCAVHIKYWYNGDNQVQQAKSLCDRIEFADKKTSWEKRLNGE